MTSEQAAKLKNLHDRGYTISIDTRYVDTPVKAIYEDEDGCTVFDSANYKGKALIDFYPQSAKVSKPVEDWESE